MEKNRSHKSHVCRWKKISSALQNYMVSLPLCFPLVQKNEIACIGKEVQPKAFILKLYTYTMDIRTFNGFPMNRKFNKRQKAFQTKSHLANKYRRMLKSKLLLMVTHSWKWSTSKLDFFVVNLKCNHLLSAKDLASGELIFFQKVSYVLEFREYWLFNVEMLCFDDDSAQFINHLFWKCDLHTLQRSQKKNNFTLWINWIYQ